MRNVLGRVLGIIMSYVSGSGLRDVVYSID